MTDGTIDSGTMDCGTFRERLAAIADDGWERGEVTISAELEDHATGCPVCRHRLEALRAAVSGVAVTGSAFAPQPPPGLADRIVSEVAGRSRTVSGNRIVEIREPRRLHSARFLQVAAAVLLIAATAAVTTVINRATNGGGTESPVIASDASPTGPTVEVHLVLQAPQAQTVAVVGDWNDWDRTAHRLTDPDGDGVWELTFRVEAGREYEYQFLVDESRWMSDPASPIAVEDGFGGINSILDI